MTIDIDELSEADLIDLNHRIVARLRILQELRTHKQMLEFRIGDRVSFAASGHGVLTGTLVKYNLKSVTVVTENGGRWNVSPSLSHCCEAGESRSDEGLKLLRFPEIEQG